MKYIPKRLVDFLWINLYDMNWNLWYDRVYESKTMDVLEFIYKQLNFVYSLFLTLVHKIAFWISFVMFALIPSAWGMSPLKRAEILTSGIVRKRDSKKEEYQAQFQEIVDEAIDASVINAELLAMSEEDRIAHFVKWFEDIAIMYKQQDEEINEWMMKRCYIEYPTFKIHLRRKDIYENYKIVSFISTTTDWITDHIVTLGKSNKPSDIFADISSKLIPSEQEVIKAIDDNLVLPIPKLQFVLNDYLQYQWIPDRKNPKINNLENDYAPLTKMIEQFWLLQEQQKKQDEEKIEEFKEMLKDYKAK